MTIVPKDEAAKLNETLKWIFPNSLPHHSSSGAKKCQKRKTKSSIIAFILFLRIKKARNFLFGLIGFTIPTIDDVLATERAALWEQVSAAPFLDRDE